MPISFSSATRRAIYDGLGRLAGFVELPQGRLSLGPSAPTVLLRREPPALGARVLRRTAA
jgi:hypothetical protein